MPAEKRRWSKDITFREGSIGNVLEKSMNELYAASSLAELKAKVSALFKENGISTDKSREIELKLGMQKSLVSAQTYITNIWLCAKGNATYGRKW